MRREDTWWKKKRLNTSADSWEGFVAEYCGFDWQQEEQEEEEEEELTLREGGFSEAVVVKKEAETDTEKNMEETSWTREEANLDELVFNENKPATHMEEKKEVMELASDQFKPNKELLKPVSNLVAPTVDGNLDVASLNSPMKVKADSFICYKCKKSLKSARQLQTHQAFQHESVEEEQIKCMVMKCGKMFRKTSTLDNHMRGHQEAFSPNLFGPVLLQEKPKLPGLRFPLQPIQNKDRQSQPKRNHQDQSQKKPIISHQLPSSHQNPDQPRRNPVHFQQQEAQRKAAPRRLISADIDLFASSDHQYRPNSRQASLPLKMHNNRASVTNPQDKRVKMDTDAYQGLRF